MLSQCQPNFETKSGPEGKAAKASFFSLEAIGGGGLGREKQNTITKPLA